MTEEIIIDKEKFWDMFKQNPVIAADDLLSNIETIVNLNKRLEFELKITKADYEASEQVNKELVEDNLNLSKENIKQKEMIDRQWKLLEQCGVSASGELKRVSYLLENLRKENKELKERQINWYNAEAQKYKSALEEINKIAAPRFVNGLNEEADQYNQCMDRIQDKISEVTE